MPELLLSRISSIAESLQCLGYSQNSENSVKTIIQDQIQFSALVSWLSNELNALTGGVTGKVNTLEDVANQDSFNLEVSLFLGTLDCPFKCLVSGPMKERLESELNKLTLLEYLTTETQAARMLRKSKDSKRMRREDISSPPSRSAALLAKSLGLPVPREAINLDAFFTELSRAISALQPKPVPLLISKKLEPAHWTDLNRVYEKLLRDYTLRRMALLKRLDVTIQSFGWSPRMKENQSQITQVYMPIRQDLTIEPSVQLGDVLAARLDVLIIEKTSSANVRKNTQTSIAKVIMGSVPDRGGRTADMAKPPPEMPTWSKRQAPPKDQAPRGRGGFGSRGQGHQSGHQYNDRQQQQQQYNRRAYYQGADSGGGGGGGGGGRYNQDDGYYYNKRGDQQHCNEREGGYNQTGDDYNYQRGGHDYKQGNTAYYSDAQGRRGGDDYRQQQQQQQQQEPQQHGEYNTGRVADAGWQENRRGGHRGAFRGSYRGVRRSSNRY